VETAVDGLPVSIVRNGDWQDGQSTSIRAGLMNLPLLPPLLLDSSPGSKGFKGNWKGVGAAIFLLSDQPQVPPTVLRALRDEHARTLAPIVAPLVQGQRANPVLFDRLTFPDLLTLRGDVGGRAIFHKYPVDYLTWHDQDLLADVDTPEEYRNLVNGE
jgi:molybdenum cofactor cytidylyltransferase